MMLIGLQEGGMLLIPSFHQNDGLLGDYQWCAGRTQSVALVMDRETSHPNPLIANIDVSCFPNAPTNLEWSPSAYSAVECLDSLPSQALGA